MHRHVGKPRLYDELAVWWPLLSSPADYAEEAAFYRQEFVKACLSLPGAEQPATLLELGSGGGNNASHLKAHFRMTLVDCAAGMLDVSRRLNPECEHIQGDMRSLRLGRLFDAVFIHDAINYMRTIAELRQALETAHVHCRPGGAALLAPDFVRETFRPGTDHGGHDAEPVRSQQGTDRGLRYLEWTWDPDPADTTYVVDYAYLLRDEHGTTCEYDRHVLGLFERAQWLRLLHEVGFEAKSVPFHHSEAGDLEVFVGIKPAV